MKALVPLLLTGLLLTPVADEPHAGTAGTVPPRPEGRVEPDAPLPQPPSHEPFAAAATALRRRECGAARAELLRVPGPTSALLLGFYAHACEDIASAERHLLAAATPPGIFEDWRLYLLADSAAALGHHPSAVASFATLLADYPSSPLRARVLVRSAQLAAESGDLPAAWRWIAAGRRDPLAADASAQLEILAWELATRAGDAAARRVAARNLLTRAPFEAARLQVVDVFRDAAGGLDWAAFLSRSERETRTRTLLDLGVAPGALATLDAFPPAERDASWRLLRARALILSERGSEALALLAAETASGGELAKIEWERAQAAASAAAVRRGKAPLPTAQREALRAAYRKHLWNVAKDTSDPALAARALRALFVELGDDEPFELALEALRRLRQIDAADTTGAQLLWERGWREYRARNMTGAVAYWRHLLDLYPESRTARAGLYWSARAHERLGDAARSRAMLQEIAATDTTDFYRKQALARLGGAPTVNEDVPVREPWPLEPRLARARLLSDLGLDALALTELEAVAGAEAGAEGRPVKAGSAAAALRALVLGRQGQHRESIRLARQVFPDLGGYRQATVPREALELYYPLPYETAIKTEAVRQRLSPSLVLGIIHQESGFDANAISRSGARGLMQVMPATGRELAKKLALPFSTAKLLEPQYSVRLGTTYFRQVLEMFDGNVELALAGYNSGPYGLQRKWRMVGTEREVDVFLEDLTPEEPRIYFKRILVLSDSYRQLYPGTG